MPCFHHSQLVGYSGGSKTELGKPNTIPIPNVLMFWFRMVPFSNGRLSPNHSKSEHSKWPLKSRSFYICTFLSLYIKRPRLKRPFWNVLILNGWFQMVPTIWNQNIQNGRFSLGCFIYRDKKCKDINNLGLSSHFECSDLEWLGLNWTTMDHPNTELVWYSSPHCKWQFIYTMCNDDEINNYLHIMAHLQIWYSDSDPKVILVTRTCRLLGSSLKVRWESQMSSSLKARWESQMSSISDTLSWQHSFRPE